MSSETRFRVRPTFPLDKRLISGYIRRRVLRSPLTWITAVGAVIASAVTRLPLPGFVAALGGAGGALFAFWRSRSDRLEAAAIHEIIRDSNRTQDEELQRIMGVLQLEGHHQYAASLGKFLLLKQRIEGELHKNQMITRKTQEIEVLVDSLCASVCDQFTQLTRINEKLGDVLTSNNPDRLSRMNSEVQQCQQRIMKAYGVMYQTAENVSALINPSVQAAEESQEDGEIMDRLIDQLQEENEVAQRVQQRLKELE